ncbi:hypothetical protein GOBAR_DD02281 [Gossypium barbadense]|nr:hypothetical protein GOBAR_DD02281 [Gossypium barbadense]
MELVDDEDVETMVALYCGNVSDKNASIHLFVELVGMEQNEDVNAYGGISIDLNITPDIDVVGGEEECGSDHCDEKVDSNGDPDVDDVPDDIDDEDVNNDGNINASSVKNQMRRILIHNNPGPHMSLIDPDAAYVTEFSEYPEIVHPHRMNISVDYKVVVSTSTIYIGECWKAAEGCNWRQLGIPVCHGDPFTASVTLRLTSIKIIRMQIGRDKSWQWVGYLDAKNGSATSRPDRGGTCVPPATFELLPDRGLCRNPRGRPQLTRIRNKMDIREKSDRVYLCGGRRSRSKCSRRPTSSFSAGGSVESYDAVDTGRECHTTAGRIQRYQTRMRIRSLKSSEYSHCPPNLDGSNVNPHVNVTTRDPARALVRDHDLP